MEVGDIPAFALKNQNGECMSIHDTDEPLRRFDKAII